MSNYTFFTNPMSRAQIALWAFHEVGAEFDPVMVEWDDKPQALLDANPMGKLPTIIHHGKFGDRVVTEAAAICHYLAEVEARELLPRDEEKADYFRWLMFAAGPVEHAVTSKAMGWEPSAEQEMMAGFGNYDRTVATIEGWMQDRDHICGSRFTMADVYCGSQVIWGLEFGTLPQAPALVAYAERLRHRPAYRATEDAAN